MKVFPYILIRIGGESIEALGSLNQSDCNKLLIRKALLSKRKEELKYVLCEQLYKEISVATNSNYQKKLLNLKRDIFNFREIKQKVFFDIVNSVSEETARLMRSYDSLNDKIETINKDAEEAYLLELQEIRQHFRDFVEKSEPLKRGLVLSSLSLHASLFNFLKSGNNKLNKKELQTELSLIKYVTRISTKTSPFSTFTNLAIGGVKKTNDPIISVRVINPVNEVKSFFRLNNYILSHLIYILKTNREIYSQLYIGLNSTIKLIQNQYVFLINQNNRETFQRIQVNPVIELILKTFGKDFNKLLFSDLTDKIQSKISESKEALEDYILNLISLGLLEFNVGVSGVDPDWDTKLLVVLKNLKGKNIELVDQIYFCTKKISKKKVMLVNASSVERKDLVIESFNDLQNIFQKIDEKIEQENTLTNDIDVPSVTDLKSLTEIKKENESLESIGNKFENDNHLDKGKIKNSEFNSTVKKIRLRPEQIFYEDTTREVEFNLSSVELGPFTKSINKLTSLLCLFDVRASEYDIMKKFFLSKFGKEQSVDLLHFYETYFKDFKIPNEKVKKRTKVKELKDEKENFSDEQHWPFSKGKRQELREWKEEFKTKVEVSGLVKNCDIVKLESSILEKTNAALGLKNEESSNSFGAFVQFYVDKETNKLNGVINGAVITTGYGKMVSRFLYCFKDDLLTKFRDWNFNLSNDSEIFAEITDASFFNANIHPPLMSYELSVPGSHNNLTSSDKIIPVNDLEVAYNDESESICLKRKFDKKTVSVFDLGFESLRSRSPLYQMLDKFSKSKTIYLSPIFETINSVVDNLFYSSIKNQLGELKDIIYYPRIVFDRNIIIQRKYWLVPKHALPVKNDSQSDFDFFANVKEWKEKNNIPEEVFITLKTKSSEATEGLNKDDYKPQYINFNNKMLVILFGKLINKSSKVIRITEMLPNSKDMLKIKESRFATEFFLQWYNK